MFKNDNVTLKSNSALEPMKIPRPVDGFSI